MFLDALVLSLEISTVSHFSGRRSVTIDLVHIFVLFTFNAVFAEAAISLFVLYDGLRMQTIFQDIGIVSSK